MTAALLIALAQIALAIAACLLAYKMGRGTGYREGHAKGKQYGIDQEWCDQYIARTAPSKLRCGRCGRFVPNPNP